MLDNSAHSSCLNCETLGARQGLPGDWFKSAGLLVQLAENLRVLVAKMLEKFVGSRLLEIEKLWKTRFFGMKID